MIIGAVILGIVIVFALSLSLIGLASSGFVELVNANNLRINKNHFLAVLGNSDAFWLNHQRKLFFKQFKKRLAQHGVHVGSIPACAQFLSKQKSNKKQ